MRHRAQWYLLPVILVLASPPTAPPPARAAQMRAPAERLPQPPTAPAGGQRVVPQGIIIPAFRVNSVTAESRVVTMDAQSAVYGFTGRITVIGKGTVKYRWLRSDNAIPPVETVVFDGPGTRSVTSTWKVGLARAPRELWKALQIDEPNALRSNEARFTVPARGFRVTRVEVEVGPQAAFDGPCPATFDFNGAITVEGTGTVKYRWVRSDGGKGPVRELVFTRPEMRRVEPAQWKRDGAPGTTHRGWMNIEIISPNPLHPPPEGATSAVYVSPEKCRYTMTCSSSSTPQRVQLTGWSSPPTVVWVAAGSGTYPGYPEVNWEAEVKIKNISPGMIDSSRVIICSYSARKSALESNQLPPLENQRSWSGTKVQECFLEDAQFPTWWREGQGGIPDLGSQQTVSVRHKRRINVVGTGSSARAVVYVRAQVHDREKQVVTTSNWLRWELGGGP